MVRVLRLPRACLATAIAGAICMVLVSGLSVAAAKPPAPSPPGNYHVHYFCSSDGVMYTSYPAPQAGMSCHTAYFCVDSVSQWGVREVSQPEPSLACYDTPEEAFAAIGIAYDCSVSVSENAPPGTSVSKQCPGGITVTASVGPQPGTQVATPPTVKHKMAIRMQVARLRLLRTL